MSSIIVQETRYTVLCPACFHEIIMVNMPRPCTVSCDKCGKSFMVNP
jgi:ribosomal protein S27E